MPADLTVVVRVDEAELVADALFAAGAVAVSERLVPEGIELVAGFESFQAADAAGRAIGGAATEHDDEPWLDTWKQFAVPVEAGARFVLVPAWVPLPATDRHPIVIDPGRAFGAGDHPTTQLAVAALEALVEPGAAVCDLGSGSGVLALVAVACGAAWVHAVEIDPEARETTRLNADRADANVTISSDLSGRHREFDVVVANIGARVLIELCDAVLHAARPGAHLVLTGLLAPAVDEVVAEYEARGAELVERRERDGWVLVELLAPGQ